MLLLRFYRTTIGKKVVVALTGLVLVGFVVGHMLGNLKTFMGFDAAGVHAIDHYAHFLRAFLEDALGHGTFLWLVRIGLLGAVVLHIVTVIQLRQLNKVARPEGYRDQQFEASTWSSRYMFVGGIVLALFIVFHILHLTTGDLHFDGFVAGQVYANITSAFQHEYVLAIYTVAMLALAFHLFHGVWSMFQTLGLDGPTTNVVLRRAATACAVVLFIGFLSVPYAIYFNLLPASPSVVAQLGE